MKINGNPHQGACSCRVLVQLLAALVMAATVASPAQGPATTAIDSTGPAKSRLMAQQRGQQLFDGLPVLFEKNQGQADARVSYLSRNSRYNVYFTGQEAVLVNKGRGAAESTLRLQWLGADANAKATNTKEIQGKTNYFVGNDPSKWHSNAANFEQVRYNAVYPGVDLVYYGNQHSLEYDLNIAPGADASRISLKLDGAKSVHLDRKTGDLLVRDTAGSEIRFAKPLIYQGAEKQRLIDGTYVLSAHNTVRFSIGAYDHSQPLVIDPYIVYSSVFGATVPGADNNGSGAQNNYYGMAVDANGFVYLYGSTQNSIDVPTSTGSFQPACSFYTDPNTSTQTCSNFFVAKFDPTKANAASLVWATYIGGTKLSKDDTQYGASNVFTEENVNYLFNALAVDVNGYVYFTGTSGFSDYPTTTSGYNPTCNVNGSSAGGCFGGVITKLSADGSKLLYSTYYLSSASYPTTASANGGSVQPQLIAVDASQVVYISGVTINSTGPLNTPQQITTTDGSFCGQMTEPNGGTTVTDYGCDSNFFVAAFDTTKSGSASQLYAIYVLMDVYAMAADAAGNVYLAGKSILPQNTFITNVATTKKFTYNGFQTSAGPNTNTTSDNLVRLSHAGTSTYATYVGNYAFAGAIDAISADASGTVYIGGAVDENLPQVSGLPTFSSYTGAGAFIAKVDTTKTGTASLLYSTYVADGSAQPGVNYVSAISDNGAGQVAFAISTEDGTSTDFPLTNVLTQPTLNKYNGAIQDFVLAGVIDTTKTGSNALTFLSPINGVNFIDTISLDQAENLYMGGYNTGSASLSPMLTVPGSYLTNSSLSSTVGFNQSNQPFFYKITLAIGITPYSLTFPSQAVNTTSGSQAVTVTNTNTAAINFTSITASSQFAETDNCQPSLAVGASCTVNVTFTPTAIGTPTGTITFGESNISSPEVVYLSGIGVAGAAAPIAKLSPTSIAFGNQTVSTTSTAQVVTLTNTGTAALSITGITITGTNPTDFADTSACGTSLAVNASCNISVNFTPASATSFSASLSVADNATGSPQTVALTGTGTPAPVPGASLSPTSLSFPNTVVGSTATAMSTTLTNTGTASLTITGITLTGANATDFTISANTCGTMLAASATCTISATFTPASATSFTAAISVADNATGSPQTVTLTGTGIAPGASLSPTTLAFPNTPVGSTATAMSTTLTNTGNATLTITGITITGANPTNFAIATNTCGATLAAAATCTIGVTFTPASASSFSGSLSVADNASGSPQTSSLTGTGTAPQATLSPATVAFPNTTVSATSTAQTITLSNPGNASLTISGVSITGTNPADFAISTNTCGSTLAAASTCTIGVTFTPASASSFSASLAVSDNATGSPQTVSLTGTGIAAAVPTAVLSPTSLTFASTTVGSTASAQTLTLSNTGNATLNISSISLTGANPTDFAETTTCGATLAASASCTFSVTFTPASVATFTATLSITDNAAASPQTATLSGTGAAPVATDFSVISTTPQQIVPDGAIASFTISMAALSGSYNSPIVMSVAGLPANATAQFTPATVTPGATGATSVLTVQTPSLLASTGHATQTKVPMPWFALLLVIPLFTLRRRSPRLACLLALGLLSSLASGCGAGYYGPQTKTYTLTVTGTSGPIQHSATVTLTVQ